MLKIFLTLIVAVCFIIILLMVRNVSRIYSLVLEAYENMQYARKAFYIARFEPDELEREKLKKAVQELYDLSVQTLDSDALREAVNKLPENLKTKALDMINSPRYGLF